MNNDKHKGHVNYEPNSANGAPADQAGRIYRSWDQHTKDTLVKNIINDFDSIEDKSIAGRAIANFYQADEELGNTLAKIANVEFKQFINKEQYQ
ncbi:catalase-related domain-containing protein [Pseudalkalibacillus hwajinpoensis]|uniref:catalase-related domain-containing protein n=1 Tax=Guptibacillus hwajinpoensis TaxID=208199 RepID=UPI00325B821E